MSRAHAVDLTVGPMSQHFRTLAIPAALGMVFSTLYNMVDIYFAGQLTTESQAGLAVGGLVLAVYIGYGFGLGSGVSALIGGALGAKDTRGTRRMVGQMLSFATIISIALIVVASFLTPFIIRLVTTPGEYQDAAIRYMVILHFAIPGFIIAYACNGALQAQGDSKSMTRALFFAFLANIVLNPLLIYGIPGVWDGIGFDGLSLSTVISQTGVMCFMLWRLLQSELAEGLARRHLVPQIEHFKAITGQMLPASFSFQVMILAGFALQFALKSFGDGAIAGYGIGNRIEQLVLLPVLGISSSLLPIVAQNFGAKDYDRVREAFAFAVKAALIVLAILCPILFIFAPYAVGLFTSDPEVTNIGTGYLRFDTLLLPVYALLFIVNSLLQAFKRPIFVLWISIYRQGFGVAFFVWLFLTLRGWDIWSVWYGLGTSVVSGLVLSWIIANVIAKKEIGGLWSSTPQSQT